MDEERYGDWIVEPQGKDWIVHKRMVLDEPYQEHQCFDYESATELAKCLARNAV